MKRIYISIPITGHPKARERADLVKVALSRKGWLPTTPFEIYAGNNPEYTDYLAFDIRTLLQCDAVYFCGGWENSCGCTVEHSVVESWNRFHPDHPIEMHYEHLHQPADNFYR